MTNPIESTLNTHDVETDERHEKSDDLDAIYRSRNARRGIVFTAIGLIYACSNQSLT